LENHLTLYALTRNINFSVVYCGRQIQSQITPLPPRATFARVAQKAD